MLTFLNLDVSGTGEWRFSSAEPQFLVHLVVGCHHSKPFYVRWTITSSGILAWAISKMRGVGGQPGWAW